jgi:POT family proton-dependent oligopeptide transporter
MKANLDNLTGQSQTRCPGGYNPDAMSTLRAKPDTGVASDTSEYLDRAFLGHSNGPGYLAFTEAWERFSYYGMQTLLVLYMVKELLLPGHIEHVWFFEPIKRLYGLEGQPIASAIFKIFLSSHLLTGPSEKAKKDYY